MYKEKLARKAYEAFNRGDMATALGLCQPDVVFQRPAGLGTVHGREALADYWAPDAFEWQQVEPLEFTEDGDRMLVEVRGRARGAGSGIEVDQHAFHVMTIRDDKMARLEVYFDREEALAAFRADPA